MCPDDGYLCGAMRAHLLKKTYYWGNICFLMVSMAIYLLDEVTAVAQKNWKFYVSYLAYYFHFYLHTIDAG